MSQQSFGILPKVAEVDAVMTPDHQTRIVEMHPELTFAALNGPEPTEPRGSRSMAWSKKTPDGHRERQTVLAKRFGEVAFRSRPSGVAIDDVLDAFAALCAASRVALNTAFHIPATREIDARGLRMEMWI